MDRRIIERMQDLVDARRRIDDQAIDLVVAELQREIRRPRPTLTQRDLAAFQRRADALAHDDSRRVGR